MALNGQEGRRFLVHCFARGSFAAAPSPLLLLPLFARMLFVRMLFARMLFAWMLQTVCGEAFA